jgi:hypothetical protein
MAAMSGVASPCLTCSKGAPGNTLSSDVELRNAVLTHRPIGASDEPYPDWTRALNGQSGVYVIRE